LYYIKNVQGAADLLGRNVLVARATTEAELTEALANLPERRVGAFIAIPDVFFDAKRNS
jgi:hypothetical protein